MQRLAVVALAALCVPSWGQRPASPAEVGIFTCKDDQGRVITRDRPIEECVHKEQRLLNRDGSLRRVIAPTPTADEAAKRAEAELADREERAAKNDAVKYDRNLQERFPSEAAHTRARGSALDSTRFATQSAESRLRDLASERKKLDEEAEFYRGRRLPPALKQQIEGNEVAMAAQRNAIKNTEAERDRINGVFDEQLERLRKLWAGAQPGSLGPALK